MGVILPFFAVARSRPRLGLGLLETDESSGGSFDFKDAVVERLLSDLPGGLAIFSVEVLTSPSTEPFVSVWFRR